MLNIPVYIYDISPNVDESLLSLEFIHYQNKKCMRTRLNQNIYPSLSAIINFVVYYFLLIPILLANPVMSIRENPENVHVCVLSCSAEKL